ARQQRVPIRTPDQLDDVPLGAAEYAFQFLDDLAVAAYGTIEPLQVAVDHEDQIVEFFAAGERNRAQCFRLVGFAVADEAPHFAIRFRHQAAAFQILQELRLVDRLDGPQSHR